MPIRPEILSRRQELVELCRKYRVKTLEVFGSGATDRFDPDRSDIDFVVEYQPPSDHLVERYFGFIEALEALFGRHVDLITSRSIRNKYLLQSINLTRTLVYAA